MLLCLFLFDRYHTLTCYLLAQNMKTWLICIYKQESRSLSHENEFLFGDLFFFCWRACAIYCNDSQWLFTKWNNNRLTYGLWSNHIIYAHDLFHSNRIKLDYYTPFQIHVVSHFAIFAHTLHQPVFKLYIHYGFQITWIEEKKKKNKQNTNKFNGNFSKWNSQFARIM